MRRRILIDLGFIGVLLAVSLLVVLPYFAPGFFPTHDGEWVVVRLGDMFRQLRDLQIPPRYSGALNFGYGYPLFNFAYPFPYYMGIFFYIPFHSFVMSIKTLFVLSVFLSAIFMYMASYQLWKSRVSGFTASFLYIYLPYRMVDLYVRGSIGESLSFALFPLIFYLSLKLFDTPFARTIVIALSISIGMLTMTHNIMTVLFLPVLILFVVIRLLSERRWDVLQSFLLSLVLGLGVSFFFWFPALYEKGNILLSKIPIADRSLYFVKPMQLLIPSWGYAPPTEKGGFSYQLGIGQIVVIILSSAFLIQSFIRNHHFQTPAKFYAWILLALYGICIVLMFPISSVLWRLPLLHEINYPWTLLAIVGFLSSLLSGFLVVQGRILKYVGIGLCVLSLFLVLPYASPSQHVNRGENYYLTNEATTTSSSELMPLWVKEMPIQHYKSKVDIVNGDAELSNLKFNSRELSFTYKATSPTAFQINTIYYPGWKAYLNGEQIKISYNNPQGVMQLAASQYRNSIHLVFEETLARTLSDVVSVVSILVILFILLRPILLFKS